MCVFLIFFWWSGVLGDLQGKRFFAINSRFGEFNTRLGRREFPVRSGTGIDSQEIDLPCSFLAKRRWCGKIEKIPGSTGKTGCLAPLKRGAWRRHPKTTQTSLARSRSSPFACQSQSTALRTYRANSSFTARSIKSSSSGFCVGLPARCPQIDGMGRSSACRM
jgi:hypothetical protein